MSSHSYEQPHRSNHPSDGILITRILISFFLIVISIGAIYIVVRKVMSIKILERISLHPEVHDSINITTDTNSGTSLFITDDKGLKFRKEDKTFAREEWIEKNGELFYFDTAGYGLDGDLKVDGQVYTFENGKLKNIKRDTGYVNRADDDLFSSIKSAEYLVWLDDSERVGNFYPIKYSLINGDESDYLGTVADKQYASPNMIKIFMSNIYYLAVGGGDGVSGQLYRMRPGAIHKETVGVGVTGFIVLSEDVIYYCDGNNVMKARNWKGIELKLPENEELNEDGEIIIKTATPSDGVVVNEKGETLAVNISDLPTPDDIEEIIPTETSSTFETSESPNTRNLPIADETTLRRRSEPVPADPIVPIITGIRDDVTNDADAPKVVEAEAPH